jgi:hypothetical protein
MFQPRNVDTHFDPDELGATALTAFFNITAGWDLAAEEERVLLGAPPRSTFFKWKSEKAARWRMRGSSARTRRAVSLARAPWSVCWQGASSI